MNFLNYKRWRQTAQAFMLAALLLPGMGIYAQTMNGNYPQEKLLDRIERIKKQTNKNIICDAGQLASVNAPALEADGISLEELLKRSVAHTNFTVEKVGASFAVRPVSGGASQQKGEKRGKLSGTVVDKNGFPVVGATVVVEGLSGKGTATNLRGDFTIDGLPARIYTVKISCISYQEMRISDIKIAGGKSTPLDVILQDASKELDEVVVTATYNRASANGLYAKQKAMVAMSDGISADLIKKTSDNNVAQVLRRVSGVTIDNGKYVTVRGMGERYNNVQLNGATLPSTEPNRRNFSFDVIPSVLVDNVIVAKTFTPDLPGEFTGGLVEVQTLAVPDKKFFNISVGTGMNTISTGKDFLSNDRYGSDWFFGNIDDRKWYAGQDEEATKQSMINAGRMNSYGLRRFTAAPMQNYSMTVGLPFEFGYDQKIGVVAALTYRNEQTREEIEEAHFITGDTLLRPGNRYKFVTTTGAVANIGWEMPEHKITWRNLFNNRFSHTSMERYIFKQYENYDFTDQYSSPLQSRVVQTQLDGEHHLFGDKLILTWNGSYNKSTRTNPDDRYATGYLIDTDNGTTGVDWSLSTMYGGTLLSESHIMYGNLDENKKNIAGNLAYPFIVKNNKQQLKLGYMGTFRHAEYEQIYMKPTGSFASYDPRYGSSISDYFDPSNFEDGTLKYKSGMGLPEADFYKGEQTIHAAYLMGEFTFFRKLHLTAGVRMEKGSTETNTKIFDNNQMEYVDTLASVKNTDWLPSATLVYNILDNLNARFAYSKTLARPDFRELSVCRYYNVDDRVTILSMGPIKQSYADNVDLRIEWYPQPGEVVSVSGFYKKFKDPVELVTDAPSPQDPRQFSFNLESSIVKGIEVNLRKSLGFLAPASFLKDTYLNANATFIKGNVEYNLDKLYIENGATQDVYRQDRKRPLQGLAPYTVNAGLTYQGKVWGAALNYGRSGRKLVMAGEKDKFDQYEAPRNVLDLQVSARFFKEKFEVKFNVSDMLNEDIIIYRNCKKTDNEGDGYADLTADMDYNPGDWVISRIKKGVNLSLSASYKF